MNISKTRQIIGWIISGVLTVLFLYSAAGKLFLHPEQMGPMHLANWRVIIAFGEIASALLFLFPRTNVYGTLLLSSYMEGNHNSYDRRNKHIIACGRAYYGMGDRIYP